MANILGDWEAPLLCDIECVWRQSNHDMRIMVTDRANAKKLATLLNHADWMCSEGLGWDTNGPDVIKTSKEWKTITGFKE